MKILISGDFVENCRIAELFQTKRYKDVMGDILPYTSESDYSIVNLECPVVDSESVKGINKTGPNLKGTKNILEAMKFAGYDCATLANNHFRDYGDAGVNSTCLYLEKYGIDYCGGGRTKEKAEENLYKKINGETLAIINVCEHEWSIAEDSCGGSAGIDIIKMYNRIQEAMKRADYTLVIVHGGIELYSYPTIRMKKLYRFFIDSGASAVINHHQHCICGYEEYKKGIIFYGLGNFIFDCGGRKNNGWNRGYSVLLCFDDDISYKIIPHEQCAEKPKLTILEDTEEIKNEFRKLNNVLADDEFLKRNFRDLVSRRLIYYVSALEPDFRIYKILRWRKFIPSTLTRSMLLRLFAYLRCESHYDVMMETLRVKLWK
ncbi:CapA family protein [uncultured Bacteroides sp.]|uniref:CapA family protein n=1 Tax=uncultured Bacteroides sp. TaxID=162156 RepID=UPI0025E5CAD7|nr:CapA family protein [uncultured Bacteroides sp.]